MGRKIVISEEEIRSIRKMYGLLTEDGTRCDYKDWVNGDGKTKPKITENITDSKAEFTYEGPMSGFCIQSSTGDKDDSIHQLSGVAAILTGAHMKKSQINKTCVYPNIEDVKMTLEPNYFKIEIPLLNLEIDHGACSTSIDRRGGLNQRTQPKQYFNQMITAIEANDNLILLEKKEDVTAVSSDNKNYIVEHWAVWIDKKWQEDNNISFDTRPTTTPSSTTPTSTTTVKTTINDYAGFYIGKDEDDKEIKQEIKVDGNNLVTSADHPTAGKINITLTPTSNSDVFNVTIDNKLVKQSSGTATFGKNKNGKICNVTVKAKVKPILGREQEVNSIGFKEGVDCNEPLITKTDQTTQPEIKKDKTDDQMNTSPEQNKTKKPEVSPKPTTVVAPKTSIKIVPGKKGEPVQVIKNN